MILLLRSCSSIQRSSSMVVLSLKQQLVQQQQQMKWCYNKILYHSSFSTTTTTTTTINNNDTNNNNNNDNDNDNNNNRPIALIFGVANQRSIAWSCVEAFLQHNYDCILTYQDSKYKTKMEKLQPRFNSENNTNNDNNNDNDNNTGQILARIPCNVVTDIPKLFQQQIPEILEQYKSVDGGKQRKIHAIVHSIAYVNNINNTILQTSIEDYLYGQHISAYSFLHIIQEAIKNDTYIHPTTSFITLSYIGSQRVIPGYNIMSPIKASLESLVRCIAYELIINEDTKYMRCNAISSGPITTNAARGGITNFRTLHKHVQDTVGGHQITAKQIANTAVILSNSKYSAAINGQIIYVDYGFNNIIPIPKN